MAWLFTLMSLLAFGAVTSEEGNSPTPQTGRRGKCNFHFNIEQPQKHIMLLKDMYLLAFCKLNLFHFHCTCTSKRTESILSFMIYRQKELLRSTP